MSTVDEIRARADAAHKGPWGWFGNTKMKNVYLATKHSGRIYIMLFERWGMQSAKPIFQEQVGPGEYPQSGMPVVWEVAPDATSDDDPRLYRHTIRSIRNPDAEFIAHSRQDVDDLLAEIDRLNAELENWHRAAEGE